MPSNSGTIKAEFKKNVHAKKFDFQKKSVHHLDSTCDLLNASQLLYPLSHVAVVFDGMLLKFSPLLCLQPTAEGKLITALTCDDKLEVRR